MALLPINIVKVTVVNLEYGRPFITKTDSPELVKSCKESQLF